jgi:putative ABC transport system permease protein
VTALFVAPPPDERVNRYLVRTEPGRSAAVMAAAPAALGADDPDRIVTTGVFGMDHTRSGSIAFGTVLILSAMTASLGVVAVLGNLAIAAFLVGERRRVIGVRRALGATRPDILGYLLLETLIPTQIGNLLGFVALVAMLPVAQKRFSGLRMEPADMLATALLLSLAGVAARLLPALRATRIPPSEASRSL